MKSIFSPSSIQFITTNKCFLKCKFCDEPSSSSDSDIRNEELERQSLEIIDLLADWGINKITFSGGEPTLAYNLKELIKRAKKSGFNTSLATNGVKLLPSTLEEIIPYLDTLKLSIHGISKTHDKIVGYSNAFPKVINTLRYSAKIGKGKLKIEVTCVVVDKNLKEIPQILDICLRFNISQLTLSEVYPRGRGKNFLGIVSSKKIQSMKSKLLLLKGEEIKNKGLNVVVRPARPSCVLVYPSGEVFISHYLAPSGLYRLGNLFKDNLKDIWKRFPFRKEFEINYKDTNG